MDIRSCTQAFERFNSNMSRLNHFWDSLAEPLRKLVADRLDLSTELQRTVKELHSGKLLNDAIIGRLQKTQEHHSKFDQRVAAIVEWIPVMLVTFVEAYLQEVLAYVASKVSSLMTESGQFAKYTDVVQAESIESLANELRVRWARSIIDDGGPRRWTKRLPQMLNFPPDRYRNGLADDLELVWGVRHVIVHAAGFATRDFVTRHPQSGISVGQRIEFSSYQLNGWIATVNEFSEATDKAIVARAANDPLFRDPEEPQQ